MHDFFLTHEKNKAFILPQCWKERHEIRLYDAVFLRKYYNNVLLKDRYLLDVNLGVPSIGHLNIWEPCQDGALRIYVDSKSFLSPSLSRFS